MTGVARADRGTMAAMRLWIIVALAACQHAEPAPAAPKQPAPCARAAGNMVATMLARLPVSDAPPTEAADGLRNLIRERCEHDAWSAEAMQCLIAMTRLEDAEPCAKLMTEAQQAALVRDGNAQFGGPTPSASHDAQPKVTPQ